MAQQTVSIGSSANDGTGDPLRTAFTKINANFSELYGDTAEANDILDDTSPQLGGNLDINGFNITSARSNENIRIIPNGTGTVELEGTTNVTGSLTATGNIFANGNINLGDGAGDQTKVTGVFEADQLQIDGTTLTSTVTNGSVTIQGNGTGGVNVADITINDNKISASNSNSDLELSASGTGNVVVGAIRIRGTNISSDDSSQITIAETLQVTGSVRTNGIVAIRQTDNLGAHVIQAQSSPSEHLLFSTNAGNYFGFRTGSSAGGVDITISGNKISSGASNADLELDANGTGAVSIETIKVLMANLPTSDPGVAGQLWRSTNDLKISTG